MPETQQHKQQTVMVTTQQQGKQLLPQQPATAQQLSTTQEPLQQQLFSAPAQIVPHMTELTEQRQQMSQQQVATTQATVQQQQQMHITSPQVKSEDGKLLTGYEPTPELAQGAIDGQVQQCHEGSNIIDWSTSALAILADSSLQHNHSASRLSHASSSATAIPTTNTTRAPIISTVNVSNVSDASGAKHVQSSVFIHFRSCLGFGYPRGPVHRPTHCQHYVQLKICRRSRRTSSNCCVLDVTKFTCSLYSRNHNKFPSYVVRKHSAVDSNFGSFNKYYSSSSFRNSTDRSADHTGSKETGEESDRIIYHY